MCRWSICSEQNGDVLKRNATKCATSIKRHWMIGLLALLKLKSNDQTVGHLIGLSDSHPFDGRTMRT